jgi:hypothetical protein
MDAILSLSLPEALELREVEGHHQHNQPRDKSNSRQGATAISCSKPIDFAAISPYE